MSFLQNVFLEDIIDNITTLNISDSQQNNFNYNNNDNNDNNELIIKSFINEQTNYLTKIYNDNYDNIIVMEDDPKYHYNFNIISNFIINNYTNFINILIINIENNINRSLQPHEIIDIHTFIEYFIEFN